MGEAREPERRRLLYGRRKGPRLSARQAGLLETLLPRLAVPSGPIADACALFAPAKVEDVWLEIGFGGGEHLVAQAAANPRVGLIGCEAYITGMAQLLAKLADAPRENVRLHMGDALDVIDALPAASLGRVFVLFPDPWPKTRHAKRRFIQTDTLDMLARVLRPGGELRLATDNAGYLAWALERFLTHPDFRWAARGPEDWRTRPADWPPTRYEAKRLHGAPAFLRFLRR